MLSLRNVFCLTTLGAAYLAVFCLTFIVHPGTIVTGLALPAVTSAAMAEIDR